MRIVFSNHAKQQMKERGLTELQVKRVIKKPHLEIIQYRNRIRTVKIVTLKKKKYVMVVIYDLTDEIKEIVTAFLTSKIDKYL